ncbi:molybdopterin-synthase adenylyltransferase MoeB [Cryobacterium tagatosivorans]|uniref:Molybdopterin-synthase adenylyltransferase MoeB n=1 Tax=Cryobacterium tagatosivorans TaxID=1259199 RepID=A0A4R8UKC7_9MICO|nr:molybdopterin-synthase adenylyltransferase MoeB [Cryobacterium tagatosivorans]TFB56707.1 molybdopterin-synthase adenylyltransferase MoeB [Cryobacterium tagatosivorans]
MSAALSPLVEPGADLTGTEVERYSRHILIPEIGAIGQRRLKNARVLVVGAGGLGSPVLLYLAAAGLGTLGIVDDDIVDLSNLQRQVIHGMTDVGRSKLESARDAVAELNPLVTVRLHQSRLDRANALALFADYDLIVDGSDSFATRYLVNDAAAILGKPYVFGSVSRFDGQVSVFWAKHGPNYRDLYPEAPPAGSAPSCGEGGVFGMLCGAVGAMMVSEAVKLITGVGRTLLGRVLLFNALGASWREITVSRDPAGEPVTELLDYELFCETSHPPDTDAGAGLSVRELAGMLDARGRGECDFELIDVREPGEHEMVRIPGSRLIPMALILGGDAASQVRLDQAIVLYCKAGLRSAEALFELRRQGYSRLQHVNGGVLAWAKEIDPSLPLY